VNSSLDEVFLPDEISPPLLGSSGMPGFELFKRIYRDFITKLLDEMVLTVDRARILKCYKQDIVDITAHYIYTNIPDAFLRSDLKTREYIELRVNSTVGSLTLDFPIRSSAFKAMSFFDSLTHLYMRNAGIEDVADVEELKALRLLKYIDISGNRLKSMPNFSEFPQLENVLLNKNPIIIRSRADFMSNGQIKFMHLENIPSACEYRGRSLEFG